MAGVRPFCIGYDLLDVPELLYGAMRACAAFLIRSSLLLGSKVGVLAAEVPRLLDLVLARLLERRPGSLLEADEAVEAAPLPMTSTSSSLLSMD